MTPVKRRAASLAVIATLILSACGGSSDKGGNTASAVSKPAQFRQVPSPIPKVEHGTLLKFLPVAGVVKGAKTYKVMYSSRAVSGAPIVVTGVVIVPESGSTGRSRPVLSIGHGTAGLADQCAPSATRTLGEAVVLARHAVANNWILAATDYEGLGTPGVHPYLVGASEGRGMLDAALAAAQLPGANASDQVLLGGYSQGGHAALFANQIAETWAPSLDVLGAFSGAPASEVDVIVESGRAARIRRHVIPLVAGFAAAYPDADPARYLTGAGLALLERADDVCIETLRRAVSATAPAELVRPEGTVDEQWVGLAKRNTPGSVTGSGPILIVHSSQDDVVPVGLSARLHQRLCAAGQVVERRVIDGGRHAKASALAYAAAIPWFQLLVSGSSPVNDCASPD